MSNPPQIPSEDSFFELLAETLENMGHVARGQFLQRFFNTVTQLNLTESVSLEYWKRIWQRRRELADSLGKPVSLKTAMLDVLASSTLLRVPVMMEYDQLKELQRNAATDPLTELNNRRQFEEHFEKELNRAQRYTQNLALVILDLHLFKEVNDRYGHPRGDLLLKNAADTVRKSLRTSDYAFRIGGDEFALLLAHADAEQATALTRRMRAAFASGIESMQMGIGLGIDYGIAVFPNDGDQRDVLIRVADERLYEMKNAQHTASAPARPPAAQRFAPGAPKLAASAQRSERRKWERVSLAGTRAYAQLMENPQKTARVLDLGYGGIALEGSMAEDLGADFDAVLHVPIFPPARVNLKKLYRVRGVAGQTRVGCAFVTGSLRHLSTHLANFPMASG
jgi:diguanylate cyclase (GGDEF)-like protein